jgi:transposase
MPRGKQFDAAEKAKIMAWFYENVAPKEIAARLKRDVTAIRKIIRDNKTLPPSATPPPPKKRTGRPSLSSFRQQERLRRYVLRFPFKTGRELKAEVQGWSNLSVRTIQRVCKDKLGLPSRCAAKKPLLTAKMLKKRIAFCKKHRSWTKQDWEKVMFSDESTFRLINPRAQKVRRPTLTNRYKQRYVVVNVKHSASVMIWGCFSGQGGRGSLYFLPPKMTMNGERYIEMLRDKLIFWMRHHRATHFLQDGAPCHTSKKVMAFLRQQSFSLMDWPGNSPDLNPIENLWAIMKARLKKKGNISSLPNLIRAIKELWVTLPKPLMLKLAHSMPTRIQQCLENNGQMTKY